MSVRLTIKDIAREFNVHHSTVSRALKNDKRVKEETRKKIVEYAKAHGYRINMNALQLRDGIRTVIAIIVPNINHQFFSNIISTVTNLAYKKGYVVTIFQTNENFDQEEKIINTVIQNNVAGVIASVSMETESSFHFAELKKYKIPLILFDRVCDDLNVSKVLINNAEVLGEAVNLLVNKGYKRIAHITGTKKVNVFRERQNGYANAILFNKLTYNRTIVINKGFSIEDGKISINELFTEKEKPDAIICDSFTLMTGVIIKLRELKVKFPDEIGLISFGDSPSMEVINPAITAIVQPEEEVAVEAFNLLLEKIESKNENLTQSITVSATIIERNSC